MFFQNDMEHLMDVLPDVVQLNSAGQTFQLAEDFVGGRPRYELHPVEVQLQERNRHRFFLIDSEAGFTDFIVIQQPEITPDLITAMDFLREVHCHDAGPFIVRIDAHGIAD